MTLSLGPEPHDSVISGIESDDDSISGNSESRVTTMLLCDSPMDIDSVQDDYGERSMDLGTNSDHSEDECGWGDTGDLFIFD